MAASAPQPFYRATTDWRVVLIRGDGFGGLYKEERQRGEGERLTLAVHASHSNLRPVNIWHVPRGR